MILLIEVAFMVVARCICALLRNHHPGMLEQGTKEVSHTTRGGQYLCSIPQLLIVISKCKVSKTREKLNQQLESELSACYLYIRTDKLRLW